MTKKEKYVPAVSRGQCNDLSVCLFAHMFNFRKTNS